MTTYELINPSDPILFEAKNDLVASLSVILVNEHYGWTNMDTDESKMFLNMTEEGFENYLGESITDFADKHYLEIAETLRSFKLNDETNERTSTNDIVSDAHAWAEEVKSLEGRNDGH